VCSKERKIMLANLSDFMPAVSEWPAEIARAWLGARIKDDDRLKLVWFWGVHSSSPGLIVKWAQAQPGWLRYKESAVKMADKIAKWRDGKYSGIWNEAGGCWYAKPNYAWSVDHQQYEDVVVPHFAMDEHIDSKLGYTCGRAYWNDAIKELHEMATNLPYKPKGCGLTLLATTADWVTVADCLYPADDTVIELDSEGRAHRVSLSSTPVPVPLVPAPLLLTVLLCPDHCGWDLYCHDDAAVHWGAHDAALLGELAVCDDDLNGFHVPLSITSQLENTVSIALDSKRHSSINP
jgi:hypothetical protein